MRRLLAIIVVGSLFLGGAEFAQSFEPPSIPRFSGTPGLDVPTGLDFVWQDSISTNYSAIENWLETRN